MFSILIEADGRLISAGFSDFSMQAVGGRRIIEMDGDELPRPAPEYRWDGAELLHDPLPPPPQQRGPGASEQLDVIVRHLAETGQIVPDEHAKSGSLPRLMFDRNDPPPQPPTTTPQLKPRQ
jgi:hypothetical protein